MNMTIKDVADIINWTPKVLVSKLNNEPNIIGLKASDAFPELPETSVLWAEIKTLMELKASEFKEEKEPIANVAPAALTQAEVVDETMKQATTIQQVLQLETANTQAQISGNIGAINGVQSALEYIHGFQASYMTVLSNFSEQSMEVANRLTEEAAKEYQILHRNSQESLSNVYSLQEKIKAKREELNKKCQNIMGRQI